MRRIYVDLDDVLAETGRMLLSVLESEFGRVVAFDDMRSFHLGESLGLDSRELAHFMDSAHRPDRLESIEPMPGAVEALSEWQEAGYEVFVVTGRPSGTLDVSLAWLQEHSMPYSAFHFLDKYSQTYTAARAEQNDSLSLADLPQLDFCLAVEDFGGIVVHLALELGVPVALFERPWNHDVEELDVEAGAPVVRCRDWQQILARFPSP